MKNQELPVAENNTNSPTIAMLAGEASGDMLGASLIRELRKKYPQATFVGIGGPLMIAEGFRSLHDMERLSVMGFVEPLKRLPELLKIRSSVIRYFKKNKPAVFIGIDSPDFNLGVEKRLKKSGIKTVHYVSPSVWAWRQGRIKKIKAAVDHVLCLLPFEADFYVRHGVPVTFVGHPMADEIEVNIDKAAAKRVLGIRDDCLALAILPGSRSGEIKLLAPLFMEVAKLIPEDDTMPLEILVAAASESSYQSIKAVAAEYNLQPRIFLKQAREVLAAADLALVASGTVTLECMLMKTPMVVAYKLEKFSFWIAKKLVKIKYIALPNLLAEKKIVSEYVQEEATEMELYQDISELLQSAELRQEMVATFSDLHRSIRRGASAIAAEAVSDVMEKH